MSVVRSRVLSIGSEYTVLSTRNRVLEAAGFEVISCFHPAGAMQKIESESFEAVVLGDSLTGEMRLVLLRAIKQMKPDVPVIVVYQTGDFGEDINAADANCEALDGPEQLINTVSRALGFEPRSVMGKLTRAANA